MALKDDVFQKHLNATKKKFNKKYNHFRPFDDPDYKNKLFIHEKETNRSKKNINLNNKQEENDLITLGFIYQKKQNTNQAQTEHKLDTNQAQTRHKLDTNQAQTEHKLDTKPNTNIDTNGTQTRHKKTDLNSIVGEQRKLLFFIYDLCKINGTKITSPLNLEVFYENTFVEKGSIKTSLSRLIQKGFLLREGRKTGRAGWVVFRIPDTVYQELFNNDVSLSLTQTRHKLDTKPDTKPNTTPSIVSSSYINTTTYLSEDFKQIDYSSLIEFGFDESHIIQIYREYLKKPEISLSAEIVQNSINALAFDLKHNNVAVSFKNSPTVVLTALLKKGQPYSSKTPEKVLSPREEAMQEYLAAQQKRNSKILEIENQAKDCAMQEWLTNLPDEELLAFNPNSDQRPDGMPEKLFEISRRKKALVTAKEYFDTVIWPSKYKQILDQDKQ
jgi:hypothetical protein